MSRSRLCTVAALAAVVAVAFLAPLARAVTPAELDAMFKPLATYDWGQDRQVLDPIDKAANACAADPALRKELENRLVAVLKSDAPRAAKDYACRKLCLMGTEASIPALAALLTDKDLSHMARYALERMEYPQAVAAMRDTLGKASGAVKVGIINSLGMREDAESAPAFAALLGDSDAQIAASAAAALGRTATPQAVAALADFRAKAPPAMRVVAVNASLDLAQRLIAKGEKEQAGKIYDELDAQGQPAHVRLAAFRGLVSARPAEAAPKLIAALGGEDAARRGQAAGLIAEVPGDGLTKALAEALPKLPAGGQEALLIALGTRGDAAARPAVLEAAKSDDKKVRLAAVGALATLGAAEDVKLLANLAAGADKELAAAAQTSLVRLQGKGVNEAMVAAMTGAPAGDRAALIGALAARTARECLPNIVACLKDADAPVRVAAIAALGELGGPEQTAQAVEVYKAAKAGDERAAAEQALLAICSRGRENSAEVVLDGMQGADAATRCVLLQALGRAGGDKALAAVRAAVKDSDDQVKDEAVRVLSAWQDTAAAGPLLALVTGGEKPAHKVLAFRGYVRLAGLQKTDAAKLAMLAEAEKLANRDDEKKLVLGALGGVETPESLNRLVAYLDTPALAEEACAAIVRIARNVQRRNKALVQQALTKVVAVTKNNRTRRDAQNLLGPAQPRR